MTAGIYEHKPHSEEAKKNMSEARLRNKQRNGFLLSQEARDKVSISKQGNKNYNWKGDNASMISIHKYLYKIKPKPSFCEICGKEKRLSLANIKDHIYTKDPNDYKWLCYSCHKKQDMQCSQCHKKEVKLHLVCDECINWKSNFIKKLKEEIENCIIIAPNELVDLRLLIDKLAGGKLV